MAGSCMDRKVNNTIFRSMIANRAVILIIVAIGSLFQSCKNADSAAHSAQDIVEQDSLEITSEIIINAAQETGSVSPLLMGFNIVYPRSPDEIWANSKGKVPKLLQQLNTGLLRYPGGTVVTFYHWEHPTGQGHKDSWDPSFDPSQNKPPSAIMDLDEYLNICRTMHTEPLVGINMGSGMKYNRVQDGIREAVRLMKHCIQKGFEVKYFYLDNEPYQPDANYTYTAAEYADMINQYATAMKKVDNQIKVIANTKPIYRPLSKAKNLARTKTLISKAGKHINFIDVHNYWAWGHATFALWKSQENMEVGATGMTYREQRSFYRNLAASLGYPEIDMVSLEWNIGPPKNNTPPTQAEAALMVAEQFMQLVQSGMKMATLWPIYWPGNVNWSSRALLNAHDHYEPHKVYGMFNLYKNILGQEKVESSSSDTTIEVLSVKSINKDTLWVYLINKKAGVPVSNIDIHIDGFNAKQFSATAFDANDDTKGSLKTVQLKIAKSNDESYILSMPGYSFAKVTLIK